MVVDVVDFDSHSVLYTESTLRLKWPLPLWSALDDGAMADNIM